MKGQGIYAYVTLMQDAEYSPELKKELIKTVRSHIGAFAAPDIIHWAPGRALPFLRPRNVTLEFFAALPKAVLFSCSSSTQAVCGDSPNSVGFACIQAVHKQCCLSVQNRVGRHSDNHSLISLLLHKL